MIYSKDIYKVCGVCRFFSDGTCKKRKRAVCDTTEACRKFAYDILKKPVKRKRALKQNDFSPDDFKL